MRYLLLLSLLAACDNQPPPPPAPAPPAPAASGSAGSSDTTRIATPRPMPDIQPSAECEQAGIKLADLLIEGAPPSQKPAFEIDRANSVRRTEIACTQQHWTPAALSCIAQSHSDIQARECLETFPSATVVAPPAGTGSAAAAGSGARDPRLKDRPPFKGEGSPRR